MHTDESFPERTYHIDVTEEDGKYAVMSISKDTARVSGVFADRFTFFFTDNAHRKTLYGSRT